MELTLIERSTDPLTSLFPLRFKHLTVPECPASVKTTSESSLFMSHTLIVLSYEPLAILVSSNWTQEIPVKKIHLIIIEKAVSQDSTKFKQLKLPQNWVNQKVKTLKEGRNNRVKYFNIKGTKDGKNWRRLKWIAIVVFENLITNSYSKFVFVFGNILIWFDIMLARHICLTRRYCFVIHK